MRVLALAAVVAVSAPAAAAPPRAGILAPGQSLGGLRLGMAQRAVKAAWGRSYGVCRGCADPTWYFNYVAFEPQGAGVSFRAGRVAAVFTLWSPSGWRSTDGLRLGNPRARITAQYPRAGRTTCNGYYALTVGTGASRTDFYVANGRLWAFGLRRPSVPPCR
jgi:hypothetical protein